MPFYPSLKIKPEDTTWMQAKKQRTAARIKLLKTQLKQHFTDSETRPHNGVNSVKIATWNLRDYGAGKYKGRDFEAQYYIAEIISHFDLVALQEVRADLKEFDKMHKILGPAWDYVATDVTDGNAGNGERMLFLFNKNKVSFRNIAGELTLKEGGKIRAAFGERIKLENGLQIHLPDGFDLSGTYGARLKTSGGKKKLDADLEIPLPHNTQLILPDGMHLVVKKNAEVTSPGRGKATVQIPSQVNGEEYGLKFHSGSFDDSLRQFARTPFLMSFQSGWLKLNLCTVHIYYGDASDESKLEQRRSEIEQLVAALAEKAANEFKEDKEAFMGVLGDFNIIGKGHPTMEALESNDFVIPEKLKEVPGSNVKKDMAYDQIAFWKPNQKTQYAKLDVLGAGVFDFFEHVYTHDDETLHRAEPDDKNGLKTSSKYSTWRTYKMSDHLPMWIELRTDFSEEYLDRVVGS